MSDHVAGYVRIHPEPLLHGGGGRRVMLRHSSRITRFILHVVAGCCDCDIIWTSIHFGTLDTPILHFNSILS